MCKDFFLYFQISGFQFFCKYADELLRTRTWQQRLLSLEWNTNNVKTDATLYYKNSSYVKGKSLYAIREDSLNSAKVLCKTKKSEADTQLCIAKQKKVIYGNKVSHALRPYAGLMKTAYEKCYQFQTNGFFCCCI